MGMDQEATLVIAAFRGWDCGSPPCFALYTLKIVQLYKLDGMTFMIRKRDTQKANRCPCILWELQKWTEVTIGANPNLQGRATRLFSEP